MTTDSLERTDQEKVLEDASQLDLHSVWKKQLERHVEGVTALATTSVFELRRKAEARKRNFCSKINEWERSQQQLLFSQLRIELDDLQKSLSLDPVWFDNIRPDLGKLLLQFPAVADACCCGVHQHTHISKRVSLPTHSRDSAKAHVTSISMHHLAADRMQDEMSDSGSVHCKGQLPASSSSSLSPSLEPPSLVGFNMEVVAEESEEMHSQTLTRSAVHCHSGFDFDSDLENRAIKKESDSSSICETRVSAASRRKKVDSTTTVPLTETRLRTVTPPLAELRPLKRERSSSGRHLEDSRMSVDYEYESCEMHAPLLQRRAALRTPYRHLRSQPLRDIYSLASGTRMRATDDSTDTGIGIDKRKQYGAIDPVLREKTRKQYGAIDSVVLGGEKEGDQMRGEHGHWRCQSKAGGQREWSQQLSNAADDDFGSQSQSQSVAFSRRRRRHSSNSSSLSMLSDTHRAKMTRTQSASPSSLLLLSTVTQTTVEPNSSTRHLSAEESHALHHLHCSGSPPKSKSYASAQTSQSQTRVAPLRIGSGNSRKRRLPAEVSATDSGRHTAIGGLQPRKKRRKIVDIHSMRNSAAVTSRGRKIRDATKTEMRSRSHSRAQTAKFKQKRNSEANLHTHSKRRVEGNATARIRSSSHQRLHRDATAEESELELRNVASAQPVVAKTRGEKRSGRKRNREGESSCEGKCEGKEINEDCEEKRKVRRMLSRQGTEDAMVETADGEAVDSDSSYEPATDCTTRGSVRVTFSFSPVATRSRATRHCVKRTTSDGCAPSECLKPAASASMRMGTPSKSPKKVVRRVVKRRSTRT